MPQILSYREPTYVGNGNIKEPFPVPVNMAQGAVCRRGDILVQAVTGSIVVPPNPGSGTFAGLPGPAASRVTIGSTTSAGAPAATYFIEVTDAEAGPKETLPSQIFVSNCPPGYVPTVLVSATGAPAGATGTYIYVGLLPDYLAQQNSSINTYATTFDVVYPLTNSAGATLAASSANANILGMAQHASNENYFDGFGGSFLAGNPGSRLGSTNQLPPLTPDEAPLVYVVTLGAGTILEMSLNAASGGFSPYMIGSAFGLTYDTATGWFTADTTATQCGNIIGQRPGVYIGPTQQGNPGDAGTRVLVQFLASTLLLQ